MNSDSLALFLAVIDHGSFSAAARHLGRVPSAVSMGIANLEADLDLILFDRSAREPVPTEAAQALEPQARSIGAQLQALEVHALELTQGLESRLTLTLSPELVSGDWSHPLALLAREFPMLQVEVLVAPQSDAMAMLRSGRTQLALIFERIANDGGEDFLEVGRETLIAVAAAGHALSARQGGPLTLASLAAHRQIAVTGRDVPANDSSLVHSPYLWRTENAVTAARLILVGIGWGWLPRSFAQPYLDAGTLTELSLANLSNAHHQWVDIAWSKNRPLGLAARRLIALMSREPA